MTLKQNGNGVTIRPELGTPYRVFYVTAWGYAADHLFGWFPKVLNLHPEIFALLAHEGSRPKYFRDLTRAERPDLTSFSEFLNDMSMTYEAIGDCYSYRAVQMRALKSQKAYADIPVLNLTRHPFAWLDHYVSWRASNMRMRSGSNDPLNWEWQCAAHGRFRSEGLADYDREEVSKWASYQGMLSLNGIIGDQVDGVRHCAVEDAFQSDETLNDLVAYLTDGRCRLDKNHLSYADAMRGTLFRGETIMHEAPTSLVETWEDWKYDAFRKLVRPKSCALYRAMGYDLLDLDKPSPVQVATPAPKGLGRDLFVSTVFKSGTWLLREILDGLTGLESYEPPIQHGAGPPDTSDETCIEYPAGRYFLWHMTIAPRVAALLRAQNCKRVFLVRNLFSILASAAHHLRNDIDKGSGRSVLSEPNADANNRDAIDLKSIEPEALISLVINGFAFPGMAWPGMAPIIEQMASLMRFAEESGDTMLLSYEELVHDRKSAIEKLADYLNIDEEERVRKAFDLSDPAAMKSMARDKGAPEHVLSEGVGAIRSAIQPYHVAMMRGLIAEHFPDRRDLCSKAGLPWLFSPDAAVVGNGVYKPTELLERNGPKHET